MYIACSQCRVLDTETASIDWKEDSDYSGGLREEGREGETERKREHARPWKHTHAHAGRHAKTLNTQTQTPLLCFEHSAHYR